MANNDIESIDYVVDKMFTKDGKIRDFKKEEEERRILEEEKRKIDDPELAAKMFFGPNAKKKTQTPEELSIGHKPLKNDRKKKQKNTKVIKIAATIIVLSSIAYSITSGVNQLHEVSEVNTRKSELSKEYSQVIINNTSGYYDGIAKEHYWYYDKDGIAKCINEMDESMHIKVYLTYKNLHEYHKEEELSSLLPKMNIDMNFQEYLSSIGFSIDDSDKWIDYMEKVLNAYVKKDIDKEEFHELIMGLNDPTGRDGGAR